MLAKIHHNKWNVHNMQHLTPNSKRWDYPDVPRGGHKKTEGSAHMVEKHPTSTPREKDL